MKSSSLRTASDRWSTTPYGTLVEATTNMLPVNRVGAARWHGRCELCCTDGAFDIELTDRGLIGTCSACTDDPARFIWLCMKIAHQTRRDGGR